MNKSKKDIEKMIMECLRIIDKPPAYFVLSDEEYFNVFNKDPKVLEPRVYPVFMYTHPIRIYSRYQIEVLNTAKEIAGKEETT